MLFKRISALTLAAILPAAYAADSISCGAGSLCPEDSPCCSQYGICGTGAYCLAACDPRYSFNLTSCVPAPVCESKTITFNSISNIVDQTKYLGDPSDYDFVTNGQIVEYDGNVLLTMANQTYGTVLTSTRAVFYGKVSATLKTSRTQGVVSAFILMSPVKDEIDNEFIGSYLEDVQTDFYWQGVLNYTNERNVSLSNTFENYHTYTIDWTEDSITWYVDGQVGRVLNRVDTYNATSGIYQFPQTPSFIQISLWPGGSSLNAQGVINWAGGAVNWDAPDIQDPGYFYVTLKEIDVECYSVPSNVTQTGNKAYSFTNLNGLQSDIEITNDDTVLGSFEAVGFDMQKGSGNDLAQVSGSVPTGVAGNGGNADRGSGGSSQTVNENVSVVSISSTSVSLADATGTAPTSTSTSSASLPNVSGTESSTTESSPSTSQESSSNNEETSNTSSAAAATSTSNEANGGFNQNGAASSGASDSTSSGAAKSNDAGNLNIAAGSVVGLVTFLAVLLAM